MNDRLTILTGDCIAMLRTLPDECVDCCVTSVPYWNLRDYKVDGQIGLERTPEEWTNKLVAVFQGVRRVLKREATCWINCGDSWATGGRGGNPTRDSSTLQGSLDSQAFGLKPKDLIGLPWRLAFALQKDGWWLRSEIIWHKKNCLPESVCDRPTKAHETIFLLSKSARYYYNSEAIMEPCSESTHARVSQDVANQIGSERANGGAKTNGNMKAVVRGVNPKAMMGSPGPNSRMRVDRDTAHSNRAVKSRQNESFSAAISGSVPLMRNRRSVWSVPTKGLKDSHFASYPPDLIKPCILAGSAVGGLVLDPFLGSGTTAMVALEFGRRAIGIDLNEAYCRMAKARCNVTPGLAL